jgi:surface protein
MKRKTWMAASVMATALLAAMLTLAGCGFPGQNGGADGGMRTFITAKPFISVWDTRIPTTDGSASNQVRLPLVSDGTYNFTVAWGDGKTNVITAYNDPAVTHTYAAEGVYTITISGTFKGFRFSFGGDKNKLLEIKQFGVLQLVDFYGGGYFMGCQYLVITATDDLNLCGISNMDAAFLGCSSLTTVPSMNNWNMSCVKDMNYMFYGCHNFNQDIGKWNVSNVTDMSMMFATAWSFNKDIQSWNVSKVTNMNGMFVKAEKFNQFIGNWNVSNVTDMSFMFEDAIAFNTYIGGWNVSKVTTFWNMFSGATAFNQYIGDWNLASATNLGVMFAYATSFNQYLDKWNVSKVTNMTQMFFHATAFNNEVGSWNVSNVTDMTQMFEGATLSTTNYDKLLNGWSARTVKTGVVFSGGNSKYKNGAAGRAKLINQYGWTITDGGLAP